MSMLRIGWATPWNHQSAIAQASEEITAELVARGHQVTLLRSEAGAGLDLPPRPTSLPVRFLADVPDEILRREFDVVVAQIGNYHDFHGALVHRLAALQAVGIFHDCFLADLAAGAFHELGAAGEARLREIVSRTYGHDVWPLDEPFLNAATLPQVAAQRPMLEWFAGMTIAAVGHSGHYANRLRGACAGPVAVIPLALAFEHLPPPPPPSQQTIVGVIGHANANKRIDQLILAISASPFLRHRTSVRIIGKASAEERARLDFVARSAGVAPAAFTGWVSDADLRRHLRDVDVMCCLRHPVLEGASASLIMALASGRPTLVSDHGCYAEVPDDAVMKCSPGAEALDVMRHLECVVMDPSMGQAMGERARAVAKQRHTSAEYVEALLKLLEQAIARRPFAKAELRLRATLHELELPQNDPAIRNLSAMISNMHFCHRKDAVQ